MTSQEKLSPIVLVSSLIYGIASAEEIEWRKIRVEEH
jgi:hypothetical protein